jgi:hypothetical protein
MSAAAATSEATSAYVRWPERDEGGPNRELDHR